MNDEHISLAIKIIKSVGFFYVLWITLLFFMQSTMIYPTYVIPNLSDRSAPSDVEAKFLETQDGVRVEYWYIKSPTLERAPTIVVFHGNASTIDFTYPWIGPLIEMGFNVLLPEFRGYGRSTGSPSQTGINFDMKKILEKVAQKPEVDLNRLVYFGESLGGGIAFDLVEYAKPMAIVTRSTFLSVNAMASKYLAPPFLIKNPYRSDKVIANYDGPVFISHGRLDTIIPFNHSLALKELAKSPTFYPVEAGHNDFPLDGAFWRAVHQFFIEFKVLPKI